MAGGSGWLQANSMQTSLSTNSIRAGCTEQGMIAHAQLFCRNRLAIQDSQHPTVYKDHSYAFVFHGWFCQVESVPPPPPPTTGEDCSWDTCNIKGYPVHGCHRRPGLFKKHEHSLKK